MSRKSLSTIAATLALVVSMAWAVRAGTPATSPHADALALVLAREAAFVAGLEADHEAWWTDTQSRQWSVTRNFPPGCFDSTHLFVVSYSIGQREVASWNVDTSRGEVVRAATR